MVTPHTPTTEDLACNPGMWLRLGIKLAILGFPGWHSTHGATPDSLLGFECTDVCHFHFHFIGGLVKKKKKGIQ